MVSGFIAEQYVKLATGISTMDRFGIRARALVYGSLYGVDPKVVMAIIWKESKGDPEHYQGDLDSDLGPSIGPMQVSRATATDMGLWSPPDDGSDPAQAFLSLSQDEDWGIKSGLKILNAKISNGGTVLNGIGLYNGSLDNPKVSTYQANVTGFLFDAYGVKLS